MVFVERLCRAFRLASRDLGFFAFIARFVILGVLVDAPRVVDALAGEDGWAAVYRKDLAWACRAYPKTNKKRIGEMLAQGWLEERKVPAPGLRLTEKALSDRWEPRPSKRAPTCLLDFTNIETNLRKIK